MYKTLLISIIASFLFFSCLSTTVYKPVYVTRKPLPQAPHLEKIHPKIEKTQAIFSLADLKSLNINKVRKQEYINKLLDLIKYYEKVATKKEKKK